MSVSAFTEREVRGTGLSPRHGNISGGVMARLNALIALCNANETALSLTHGLAEVTATPYTVPANVNIVLVDTVTVGAPCVINLPPARTPQMKTTHYQVHVPVCNFLRTVYHLHHARMRTAGQDDNPLICPHCQRLLDDT